MSADPCDSRTLPWRRLATIEHASLAAAVEQAADSFVITDVEGTILYINPAFTAMTGYTSQEAVGRNPRFLRSGRHPETFYKEMWDTIRSGQVWQGEVINRRKDGAVYNEEMQIAPVRSSSGAAIGYVAVKRNITERIQAEQALRDSEERFRNMADSCPSMLWVSNSAGQVEFINKVYRIFSGIDCEEARVGEWRMLLHPDDADKYIAAFEKAMREHTSFSAEARVRRADGEWRLVGSRGEPRFSPSGEYLGHIGLRADITERSKAEQQQQFQHSLIRAIYEGALDGIVVVNASDTIVSHNKRLLDIWKISLSNSTGQSPESIAGTSYQALLSAALERVMDPVAYLRRVQAQASPASEDLTDHIEVDLKDGRTLERYTACLRSKDGHYLGRARFFRDITERKKAELALKESEERFRIMADGCPIGIWVTDAAGTMRFVNRTYRAFCGITSEEVDPNLWLSFVHPEDGPGFVELFARALREHSPFKSEYRSRRFDGEWRWVESYAEPRFSIDQEFVGLSGTSKDITDRKQAEQALRESEDRFRTMADGCPAPMWTTDSDGEILFINRPFAEFCGDSFARVEGSKWKLLIHPDDASVFIGECSCALREHRGFTEETRILRSDGEWRWLTAYVAPRFAPDGEFLGHVGIAADITDRKQIEQALQSSEEKFRELAENIREVFWMMNAAGTEILYVSPAYEQIWGRTCESLYASAMDWTEAIHPEDRARAHETFLKQVQGERIDSEYRITTLDGDERWIRDRAFPIRDQADRLIRIAGMAEDVTAHKHHEEALIRAQAEAEAANCELATQHAILDNERIILRTFIDNVPDLMFVKDFQSRFVVANPELARWAGVAKPEDLIGKTEFEVFPQEAARTLHEDNLRVMRSGKPIFNSELTVGISANEEPRIYLATKVPLFDSNGRVTGIAGMARDITERKAMENALRESNRELKKAIDQANRLALEAEAANRSKSQFLANMSHEIRTPMNGVIGMNGLLLASDLNAEQRHYAEVTDASARSLLTVIDDILDYSKIEAGKLEIDTVDFDLPMLMGDLAEMMAERIADKPLEFVCAVAPNVSSHLRGDPGRIRQVLLNLVSNAMKFTPRGEVVVRVELTSETDDAVLLRFSVRDTGIGIPEDKQQMLFTSFTQVDASTTRQYGGTGLGLAISKKLVELMGGEIGFESKKGEGSTFWFAIRLAKQTSSGHENIYTVPVKGARILVVDDNASNREVLTAQIQSWGAAVVAVESGPAALACLRNAVTQGTPFQVALLDMMMPEMDGAMLGRAILADDMLKAIPLVMMTSLGQRGDAHRLKKIGFAAYLIKPVRQSDLFDCLVSLLAGEQQPQTHTLITHHSLRAARRSNARILLVEDNPTNQEVACGMLRRMGWRADLARDGNEALRALEITSYDLVLMDVQMPVMDGYETARRIRDPNSMVLDHNVPIIATTAHAMAGDAEKCLKAGMSDYIAKPIDPKILEDQVEKWLTRKHHEPPNASPAESSGNGDAATPVTPGAALVFNREKFLERMMRDEAFAHEVVAEFMGELPALVSTLKQHVAQADLESVWRQAHKLKGSAANVGGEALRDVAMKMEQAGKTGNSADVVQRVSELEMQAGRLIDALQRWQAKRSVAD